MQKKSQILVTFGSTCERVDIEFSDTSEQFRIDFHLAERFSGGMRYVAISRNAFVPVF